MKKWRQYVFGKRKNGESLNETEQKMYNFCVDDEYKPRSSSEVPPSPGPSESLPRNYNMNFKSFKHEVDHFSGGSTTPSASVDQKTSSGSANNLTSEVPPSPETSQSCSGNLNMFYVFCSQILFFRKLFKHDPINAEQFFNTSRSTSAKEFSCCNR